MPRRNQTLGILPFALGLMGLLFTSCQSEGKEKQVAYDAEAITPAADSKVDAEDGGTEYLDGSNTDIETDAGFLLIDDFEDGDNRSLFGGYWFAYDDSDNQGASVVEMTKDTEGNPMMDGEGFESARSLYLSYQLDQGDYQYEPYIGWGITMAVDDNSYDATGFDGISYFYKGSAHAIMVDTFDVEDYDFYLFDVPASSDWREVKASFKDLHQSGWGKAVPFNLNNIRNFTWSINGVSGESGSIAIDNVGLFGNGEKAVESADLSIQDPAPPEDEQIDTIDIDNPAQTLAMKALNKGYNITNWLEQDTFESFEYDEQYIADLASNGYRALRLPIDLDRYIENRDEYFAGNAELSVEPVLFTILDSFEQWTAAADMSLTIDYHQYDGSFDMSDPLYVDAAIALWTMVAEHFAENPREDLFFELMNEPELAGGTTSVDQEEWRTFAEQIIEGIRSEDTTHFVLFGDVSWNAISPLIERPPLDDEKVIYVFHFYEPFIFTHQGASWVQMNTTHDIPYPYSADRWSEHSSDFGFIQSQQPAWHFSSLRLYYIDGSKSALRNQIMDAKRWAVENNVAVICNEFGVYDRTSRLEDQVNYYTDLTSIFEELEIPWQHWFMLVDAETGQMEPALRTALGLE